MAVIRDYLDLERLRYGGRIDIGFQVDVNDEGQLIAPLLLLQCPGRITLQQINPPDTTIAQGQPTR